MRILSIECSAVAASCAVYDGNTIIAESFTNERKTHSETLLPMTEEMLSSANLSLKDMDYFAISKGPGSFTGIRIGISAIKGMALGVNKPCVGVSTLESMAYNMLGTECIVCVLMDARCNQFYNAFFKVNGNDVERLCEDRALLFEEICDDILKMDLNLPIVCVGDGAKLFTEKAASKGLNVYTAPESKIYQNASSVAILAKKYIDEGNVINQEDLLPFYLRLPQAERELKKRKDENK